LSTGLLDKNFTRKLNLFRQIQNYFLPDFFWLNPLIVRVFLLSISSSEQEDDYQNNLSYQIK
jgi:hypothetical protein